MLNINAMSYIMVDVEADGPIPGDYSMISIGAIVVEPTLSKTFYGELKPISDNYIPEALGISGFTREETLQFNDPTEVMLDFASWIKKNSKGKPLFISDNNGFDWMFTCWYFHHFLNKNPFGYSSQNLSSFYKGLTKNVYGKFKYLRDTEYTHHPVDDAKGNAEALLKIKEMYNLKIKLK